MRLLRHHEFDATATRKDGRMRVSLMTSDRSDRAANNRIVSTADLIVNLDKRTVEVAGAQVYLTKKETQILEFLTLRKGTVVTKEMFFTQLYSSIEHPVSKIIDVYICNLRKKLAKASGGKNYIETVRGRGYVLRAPRQT
jgi:two-component system cell cycle response regulator CtrA